MHVKSNPAPFIAIHVSGRSRTRNCDRSNESPSQEERRRSSHDPDWEQLTAWLHGHPEIRVVILCGAGDSFCAGDDVPEVGTLSIADATQLCYRQARAYLAWEQLPPSHDRRGPWGGIGSCWLCCGLRHVTFASHRTTLNSECPRSSWVGLLDMGLLN